MKRFSAGSPRVLVVGTSGCGKTTFATSLSSQLNVPHVELDALYWGPNWTPFSVDTFRANISDALAGQVWVCDGNYGSVRELVWARANTLIWLDYPFPLVFYRAVMRTVTRLVTRKELFGGNRESWRLIFGPDWIPWWVLRTFRRRRREYPALVDSSVGRHLEVIRFAKPREADAFLESVRFSVETDPGQAEGDPT